MRILILGGSLFVGRHIAEGALERGHRVTTFNRGRTNPGAVSGVEELRGDRDGDLASLGRGEWDLVVDTSAYRPAQARATAALLASRVGQYCLISTASVYADVPMHGADEHAMLHPVAMDPNADVMRSYGPLKVACEQEVLRVFEDRALIIRPGVLCGPYDPTNRFHYWVHRVADGGKVLAPGDPEHPVQLLDARDLAQWIVRLAERRTGGIYNAAGPQCALTMGELLTRIRSAVSSDAQLIWVDDATLLSNDVVPWSDLPLWLPRDEPGPLLDARKAFASGLACRAIESTALDVLRSPATPAPTPSGPPRPTPLSREREARILSLS